MHLFQHVERISITPISGTVLEIKFENQYGEEVDTTTKKLLKNQTYTICGLNLFYPLAQALERETNES